MKKPPKNRDGFRSRGSELNYLHDLVAYWWHRDGGMSRIVHELERFEELLAASGLDDGSIALQEHWTLLHQVRGNFHQCSQHREREIVLIQRALEIGGPIGEINFEYLANKWLELAHFYVAEGKNERAKAAYVAATQLSQCHGFHIET